MYVRNIIETLSAKLKISIREKCVLILFQKTLSQNKKKNLRFAKESKSRIRYQNTRHSATLADDWHLFQEMQGGNFFDFEKENTNRKEKNASLLFSHPPSISKFVR